MLLDFGRVYLGFGHLKTLVFLVGFWGKISRSFFEKHEKQGETRGVFAEGGEQQGLKLCNRNPEKTPPIEIPRIT